MMNIIKKFENFQSNFIDGLKDREEYVKSCDRLLESLGHYKDDDGYWHLGESIKLTSYFVYEGELVVKFKEVRGNFEANYRELVSLKGFPEKVDTLTCNGNNLKSLEGIPKLIQSNCSFRDCNLENVNGIENSDIGGGLDLSNNNIYSLDGFENIKSKTIYLYKNPIYFLVCFLNDGNRKDLIEYFNYLDIIQGKTLIKERLFQFYREYFSSPENLNSWTSENIEDIGTERIDSEIDYMLSTVENDYKII